MSKCHDGLDEYVDTVSDNETCSGCGVEIYTDQELEDQCCNTCNYSECGADPDSSLRESSFFLDSKLNETTQNVKVWEFFFVNFC